MKKFIVFRNTLKKFIVFVQRKIIKNLSHDDGNENC